jgi:hypothetical protein
VGGVLECGTKIKVVGERIILHKVNPLYKVQLGNEGDAKEVS